MDNIAEESILHAITFWSTLNGTEVTDESYVLALQFVTGNHKGNITDRTPSPLANRQLDNFYRQQPNNERLRSKWRSAFEPTVTISNNQATEFLVEVCSSIELFEDLFADHSFSGITRMLAGKVNDHTSYRPAGKLSGWSLNLSTAGVGRYNCIRQQVSAGPGDMILLSPDAMYDYKRESSSEFWEHQWIYFHPDPKTLKWLNWQEVGPNIFFLRTPEEELSNLKSLFDSTLEFDSIADVNGHALLLNIVEQIFIRSFQYAPDRPATLKTDGRVRKAMAFINANLVSSMTVQDIAQHVELSKTQLSLLFKQYTGSTLIKWREERRIVKASELLTKTNLQIQAVGELVGYEDPLYFSRSFSKLVGSSPRAYRSKHNLV